MSEKVICSGWMKKKGGIVKNWKKRWFELRGSRIYYYTENGGELKGTIELSKDSVAKADPDLKNQPALSVQSNARSRIYQMVTDSKEERDRWVSEINDFVRTLGGGGGALQKSHTTPVFSSSMKKEEAKPKKKEPDMEVYVPKEEQVVVRAAAKKRKPPSRPQKH